MSKSIVIVSTYPAQGSKNIGDWLITNKVKEIITDLGDYDVEVVFRADAWESVKHVVLSASHVIFACLAIRSHMHKVEYPFLEEFLKSGVPFSVIAAGTNLPVNSDRNIYNDFNPGTVRVLREMNKRAVVATTRGVLTQEACVRLGLDKFVFAGDVAFYDKAKCGREFSAGNRVESIVVSDPHYAKQYLTSFEALCRGIRNIFTDAKVVVAQHGVNHDVDKLCAEIGIPTVKIYENPSLGFQIYDAADLHVGFRVHAHVSALSRRIYSYLLEQDGRGCDYGLTLSQKLSVPNYREQRFASKLRAVATILCRGRYTFHGSVSSSPAEQAVAMIRTDAQQQFRKFVGLGEQIDFFIHANKNAVAKALGQGAGLKQ